MKDMNHTLAAKIVISGYGKMGKMVEQVLRQKGIECLAKTDDVAAIDDALARDAICIDFTTPAAFRKNYPLLARKFKAVVVGTTGWYDIKSDVFQAFAKAGTTLIWASNFSVGVNVMTAAVRLMSSLLGQAGGYSPYVVEKHHIHKLDAPSGTAKTLCENVKAAMGVEPAVSSVRVGEIPGIHTVGFEGLNDRLTIEHEAFSREGFAQGAVLAAGMTQEVEPGSVHEFQELFMSRR